MSSSRNILQEIKEGIKMFSDEREKINRICHQKTLMLKTTKEVLYMKGNSKRRKLRTAERKELDKQEYR